MKRHEKIVRVTTRIILKMNQVDHQDPINSCLGEFIYEYLGSQFIQKSLGFEKVLFSQVNQLQLIENLKTILFTSTLNTIIPELFCGVNMCLILPALGKATTR